MQAKNQFSRRQIRIKIFQLLYSLGDELEQDTDFFRKRFTKETNDTEASFATLALFILKVFDYSLIYANKEASKYVQENQTLVDTDVARTIFSEKLKSNDSFIKVVKDNSLQNVFDAELIKKTFYNLKETEEYKNFLLAKDDANVLEDLILRTAEYTIDPEKLANQFFDERFMNWEDDIEVIQRWLALLIKQPNKIIFRNTLTEEKIDFADELLSTYSDKYDYLNELIKPKLKNWDADRVAVIDTILLRLGLAELLFFPEIPVKVSINEYIDIAKMYSTDHSGQFINGVLDNLRKDLDHKGELRKHS